MTYVNRVSNKLGFNTVNEAIGGDVFSVQHLENLPDIDFDTVFIAYGTNDWKWANAGSKERITDFFAKLEKMFAKAQKHVILPIWRSDKDENPEFVYTFDEIRNLIRNTASEYGINIIDIFDMIPHDTMLYYDGFLHPNEMGFAYYASAVEKSLIK